MNQKNIKNILNKPNKSKIEIEYINNNYEEILKLLFKEADEETFNKIKSIIKSNNFFKYFSFDLYYFQPINIRLKKNCQNKEIINSEIRSEPLVALNKYDYDAQEVIQLHSRIFVNPVYFKAKRKGTFPEIYVREQVLESILTHLELLPKDYGFMVFDGYRTYECQKDIYDEILNKKFISERQRPENNLKSDKEIIQDLKTNVMPYYVSYPSFNPPSTHNTGGAIDMRICNNKGKVLKYGCDFDEFEKVANLDYFENLLKSKHTLNDDEIECLITRRITTNLLKYPTKNLVKKKIC